MLRRAIAAILLGATAPWVAAGGPASEHPRCVLKTPEGLLEPATMRALFLCQESARRTFLQGFSSGAGREAPSEVLVQLDAFQRAEMRDYAARHPEAEPSPRPAAEPRTPKPAAAKTALPEAEAPADVADLQARLQELGGDGSKGITPEMAELISRMLTAKQGGMTPEMRALLNAVEKDGATLTPETMGRLKGAAKDAKAEGLDLGVPAEIEKLLLAPPSPDEAAPGPPAN